MNSKLLILIALMCCAQVLCAPQPRPVNWHLWGQRAIAFGKQALPVVKTGCQLLNGQLQYVQPQYVQYPQYSQDSSEQYQQAPYENNYY